jgi:hypothetical protein
VLGAIIGVSAWSPWKSRAHERDLAWVVKYPAWNEAVRRDLRRGRRVDAASCRAHFDRRVGKAPSSLAGVDVRARRARTAVRTDDPLDEWRMRRWSVFDAIVTAHTRQARTTYEPRFSKIAASIARRNARVFCWQDRDWTPLAEQWDAPRTDEFRAEGIATPSRHRIDLAPTICDALHVLYAGGFVPVPNGGEPRLLGSARRPRTRGRAHSPAVGVRGRRRVPCHPARPRPCFQGELAGLALVVSYPNRPEAYRTRNCSSGGPYDLHPDSKTWP